MITFEIFFSDDPALWILNEVTRDFICRNGFKQNLDSDFSQSKTQYQYIRQGKFRPHNRYLSKDLFKTTLINGKTCQRDYLSYSVSTGKIYCIPCYLFGSTSNFSRKGFSDWKHPNKINTHENSTMHKTCTFKMKHRSSDFGRVDSQLTYKLQTETDYWVNVLNRVCSVIKSLSSHGLSFRGGDDSFESSGKNNGNFIMAMKLIAEYDPFLSKHILNYGNPGKGNTSYMSFFTYEQFIKIMAEKVISTIVEELKSSTYFSISVDSTPDISNVDQLSFVIRYVNSIGEPVERFLGFMENIGHKAEPIAEAIFSTFNKHNIDIKFLRGQSYDNAANMSGAYSGVQARIKLVAPLADFVPCSAHSLNLIGLCAASCCSVANNYFLFVQNLYIFFSSSTHRWQILNQHAESTLKGLSVTRWSARNDACQSLNKNWTAVKNALQELVDSDSEKPLTRSEASGLLRNMNKLETAFMTSLWCDILQTFNNVSKKLQSIKMDLSCVVELYNTLIEYIKTLRTMFNTYEKLAQDKFEENVPQFETKNRKRKKQIDESNEPNTVFSGYRHFKINTFYPICDNLLNELVKRKEAYDNLISKYLFILKLQEYSPSTIRKAAKMLRTVYNEDLDESFDNECIHFQSLLKTLEDPPTSLLQMSLFLRKFDLVTTFPYINIALNMFLCTPVSNCSTERSFSALKRIKNYLRSTMSSDRLNSLAVLAIESSITSKLDFSEIIKTFAEKQARRKNI